MPDSGTIPEPDSQEPADLLQVALPRSQKVVLVIDLVESVRLMSADEAGTVARWHDFVQKTQDHIIPNHHGRLVKSLGDGLMVEFEQARDALTAAQTMHKSIGKVSGGLKSERQMHLRAGIHATHVFTDSNDIYGAGVNLAARLATLAGPCETVVSAGVRDELTDGLDASIEDLGECYLKHIEQPVRAYRVGAAGAAPVVIAQRDYLAPLQPTIAVIPFAARSNEPDHFSVGELIADGVIAQISRTVELKVISRMSATAFRNRDCSLSHLQQHLGANYVLSGSYAMVGSHGGGRLLISVELAECTGSEIVWYDRFTTEVGDLLQAESECTQRIGQALHLAILKREAQRVLLQPTATLAAYTLKLSGISLMHRSAPADFEKAHAALTALADRYQRFADTHAWIAKWHVLKVIRGISPRPAEDATLALDACRRALDSSPHHPLALAVKGYVLCQLSGEGEQARELLNHARMLAPNEVHAWLYRSVWSSNYGLTAESVTEAEMARSLSPTDPHAYFFESLLATAYTCNCEYEKAALAAQRSLKLCSDHAPTLRTLMVAHYESGHVSAAKETLTRLLATSPGLTVSRYESMGSRDSPSRRRVVAVLRSLGVPEST